MKALSVAIVFCSIFAAFAYNSHMDSIVKIEAIKSGLIQCRDRENGLVLWKKECSEEKGGSQWE